MKNIKRYLTSLVFTAVLAASAYAQDAGSTALPFLKMDMGARYYGMAGAATAYADDVTGMTFYNPAALGMVESFQLAGTVSEAQLDMKYHYGGLAFPVGFLSIFGNNPLNIAVSGYMFDKGNTDDIYSRSIGDDWSFTFSIGEHIGTTPWEVFGSSVDLEHYFGITGKYLRSELAKPIEGNVSGDAFAFDAGYTAVLDKHFGVGVAIKNLGTDIKYIEESDPLPATLSAGMFFVPVDVENIYWAVSGDFIAYLKEKENRVRIGTEMYLFDLLAVRGGVKLMEEIREEWSLGFGLKLFGFEIDVGTILNPQLNDDKLYQVSLAYKFPVKKKDSYSAKEGNRNDYQEYKKKQEESAFERAQRNSNPLIYQ